MFKGTGEISYSRPLHKKWGGKALKTVLKAYTILDIYEYNIKLNKHTKAVDDELALAFTAKDRREYLERVEIEAGPLPF